MVKEIKTKLNFIDEYIEAINPATGSKYDSNANVTNKNLSTLTCEIPKKDFLLLNRAITSNYIEKMYGKELADKYNSDIENHIIYSHDETSLMPYCASISLYPFLLNGLKDLGGSSVAPKHANSYIGGLINFVFIAASQFAGAIAIPEFLTYFDYFLRKDYGEDYQEKLDDELEIFGVKKTTLKEKIHEWFEQFVYSINQPAGARNYQSPFINIAYFDEYYFENIFKDFYFPDMTRPKWETTKELQKMFMKWFNKERSRSIITFPVETANLLVKDGKYVDEETADFMAKSWSYGHSFFMYQSDSVDSLSSCCRLRNGIESNEFSYTLGAGGIGTGSKKVITLNLNRIVQNWVEEGLKVSLKEYIADLVEDIHKYLNAWNQKLWDDFENKLLPIYDAGFIHLDKQFLTVGVNGFLEAAEFLNIETKPDNEKYKQFSLDVLGTIEELNKKNRTQHAKYNLEFVPAESLAVKNYNWDKRDGYWVPEGRNLYNSYFYPVEDKTIDPITKFFYQGKGFADVCSGGVALHNNLDTHLTKDQYRGLMDVAVKAGCNYFTFNIPNTVCNDCKNIDKRMLDSCPKCGSKNIDYATRIIGYLKLVSNFSRPRQEEAKKRAYNHLKEG